MKQISRSRLGLAAALVATLLAAWFAPEKQEDDIVLNTRPAPTNTAPQPPVRAIVSGGDIEVLKINERQALDEEAVSLFAATEWQQSEALTQEEAGLEGASTQASTAPPLPFRIMGRYVEDGQSVVFLQQADQSWVVRKGDTLAGAYKVEYIGDNAIRLRYLPLNEVQTLTTESAP
jgi:hypothetical protein